MMRVRLRGQRGRSRSRRGSWPPIHPVMDYFPTRLPSLRDWARNFATVLSADPALYGVSEASAAAIQSAVDVFEAACTTAADPGTRTTCTVAGMRQARAAMKRAIRSAAGVIRTHPPITAGQLLGLGLHVPAAGRTPIPAPVTFPLIEVLEATPGAHLLRFSDSATPSSRAKPEGAVGLQLFRTIGMDEDSHTSADQPAALVGQFTKNPVRIPTPSAQKGRTATYTARWVTRTGRVGPWGSAASFTIAA